jgi:glutamyl/glutaminyl-tRNA synthetase
MNGRYIREMTPAALGEWLVQYLTRVGFYGDPWAPPPAGPSDGHPPAQAPTPQQQRLTLLVAPLVQEKIELLADFWGIAGWFFRPLELAAEALERLRALDGAARILEAAAAELSALEPYDAAGVEELVRGLPAHLGLKPTAVFAALRLGMSGQSVTPGLFESLAVLGRDEAAARLSHTAALLV